MKLINAFRRILFDSNSAAESLRALVAGCANQSDLLNHKFDQLIAGIENQSDLLNQKFDRVIESVSGATRELTPANAHGGGEIPSSSQDWKVEIRDLSPIVDEIEFPAFRDSTTENIKTLLSSAIYNDLIRPYFSAYPKMSLMTDESRAFVYGLVRMVKPELVAEIGTFYAGTAEIIARALWENGGGILYTTDPYGVERVPTIISQWPVPLQELVHFSPNDSMTFLGNLLQQRKQLDIILIDGNHAFEFASFDLAVATTMTRPGGIIIMDNAEQTGPFEAARQFLAQNPEWRELGNCISSFELSQPFAMHRCSIPGTRFIVLQAPLHFTLGPRLRSWGEEATLSKRQSPGFVLQFSPQYCQGRLHFQAVYRGFDPSGKIWEELKQPGSMPIRLSGTASTLKHQFDQPLISDIFARFYPNCRHTFELELLWEADPGSGPLMLAAKPEPQWIEPTEEEPSRVSSPGVARPEHLEPPRMDLTPLLAQLYGEEVIDQPRGRTRLINDAIETLAHDHRSVSWGDRLLTLDKSADFKKEPAFSQALATIRDSHSYDQYNGPDGIAWRLNTLIWAGRSALRTGGDFVECGTFKGDMAWVVLQTIGGERIPRFWLFDSFEGFSPDYSSAADFPDNPGFLDFANGFYRQAGLYEYVRDRFAPFGNVTLIKGFLPDTLDAATPTRIGFLHIDLNSPRAEIAVLERLFERVLPGGVIVFDDYGWETYRKQKKAEDNFMRRHGHEILELPTGQGLVIKR
jgi:predicted O-methyltransferase YrrM